MLEITHRDDVGVADTAVLHLDGVATYREAPELRRALFGALGEPSASRLIVELAEVARMDTAAMAVLVEGLLETRRRGPQLYFCTPSPSVRQVFELAGLEEALERCYGCLGDALDAVDTGQAIGCGCGDDAS